MKHQKKKKVTIIHFKHASVLVSDIGWMQHISPVGVLSSPVYSVLLIFLDKRSCNATRLPLDWYERPDFLFKCLWKYGRRPAGEHRWTVYWSHVISHFPHSSCLAWNLLSWMSLPLLLPSPLFKDPSTDIRTETFRGTRSRSGQVSQEVLTALLELLFNWKHSASHVGSWVIFSPGDHMLQIKSLGIAAERKLATVSSIRPFEAGACSLLWGCLLCSTVTLSLISCSFLCCLCVCRSGPLHTRVFVLQCFGFRELEEGRGVEKRGRKWVCGWSCWLLNPEENNRPVECTRTHIICLAVTHLLPIFSWMRLIFTVSWCSL